MDEWYRALACVPIYLDPEMRNLCQVFLFPGSWWAIWLLMPWVMEGTSFSWEWKKKSSYRYWVLAWTNVRSSTQQIFGARFNYRANHRDKEPTLRIFQCAFCEYTTGWMQHWQSSPFGYLGAGNTIWLICWFSPRLPQWKIRSISRDSWRITTSHFQTVGYFQVA